MADFASKLERLSVRGTPVGVEELIERIEAELAGDPLVVVPQRRKGIVMTKTDQPVTSDGPRLGRGIGWMVAAFIAILIVGGSLIVFGGDNAEVVDQDVFPVATTTIEGTFLLDLGTGEQTPLPDPFADKGMVSASPDGTMLYATTCCSSTDVAVLANVDGSDQRRLDPEGFVNYQGGRWSPDGTKIVYQARDGRSTTDVGNLFVEDVAGGERTQITDFEMTSTWWFLSPTFSRDGQSVFFHLPRSSLSTTEFDVWSVPVTGGEPTLVAENATFWMPLPDEPSGAFVVPQRNNGFFGQSIALTTGDGLRTLVETINIGFPSASPDGSRIAFVEGEKDDIFVVEVATGESSKVVDGDEASWLDNDTLVVVPDLD
jgi:Tol biopolymer transport system component